MTPTSPAADEQVSALADGQLQGRALEQALTACAQDRRLLALWRDYHLIGDALRGVTPLAHADEAGFLERLRPALGQTHPADPAPTAAPPHAEAANSPWYRQRWAAGVAALAVAAGLAWTVVDAPELSELAWAEPAFIAASPRGPVLRDAALQELLEAHRQQGGASVLPMPSGFLRNATFDAELATLAVHR